MTATQITREDEAMKAYLQLLVSKGAESSTLERRKEFLQRLIPHLKGQQQDGCIYRDAVNEMLEGSNKESWPFLLVVAREFFHFWTGDIKTITSLNASGGFEIEPAVVEDYGDEKLKQLWKNIDTQKFSISENWPIKAYAAALREEGAEQSVVETRVKLVKLLLTRLRDVPEGNSRKYRVAADSLLSLFVMKELRFLFLVVVREFYYFWAGDPDAASHIFMDDPGS